MWWLQALLFFLLSPGVILTLPPVGPKIFYSGKTSVLAAFVHALVFAVVSHYVYSWYMDSYEGFASCGNTTEKKEGFRVVQAKVQVCPQWRKVLRICPPGSI